MKLMNCQEMRELENRVFASGISAEALMAEAGEQIAAVVRQFFPNPGRCLVYFGKGHNGGDALVAARHLAEAGWVVEPRAVFEAARWSPLTAQKFAALNLSSNKAGGNSGTGEAAGDGPLVVLDGLLGIGAGGALREPIAGAAREMNRLRRDENAYLVAIDLPTGLNGDTGEADPDAVRADFTTTIGFPKRGLLADGATRFVGRLCVLPLAALTAAAGESAGAPRVARVATARTLARSLPRREFDLHKGHVGRVAIVAGSHGLIGAAVMSATACVRAGAGLVTLYVTEDIHSMVSASASPEVMVRAVGSYLELLEIRHDVIAIGPGLGFARMEQVLELIQRAPQPMVIDADALTMLAHKLPILEACAGPRLLTPHPGEMARLDPASGTKSRAEILETFTSRYPHTLLLKGARTLVGQRGFAPSYNSTGSPGMASGGMGDVLTGVCAALCGQGLSLFDSARLGAWLCGRAAELAIFFGVHSEESLSAVALTDCLGLAFKELRKPGF